MECVITPLTPPSPPRIKMKKSAGRNELGEEMMKKSVGMNKIRVCAFLLN